ncbi:helix-turn-helix domain-containing protein [Caulobacter segnis]|uniref:Helix-turn-helix domain-containing protein n=1 Tax=Caulobacter segnis TaxID=88688 RepID=A0A2W5VFH2_9CAUL|nr:helix-turn-helix domain-containing protein [Caulobacter segnis]PZR37197.1 MAG: hypothetical protein DI526_01385 [Caulobacter segnis]
MSGVIEIDLTPFSGQAKREPLERRTGSAVRRRSKAAGGEKGTTITWTQRRLRLDAFDRIARERRQPGRRWGAAGTFSRHDREILAQLLALAARHRGQVFPTIQEIAHRVGCTVRSVVNGLKRLKAAGFVEWDRRYVETGKQGLRGPQVEQTSNFYYLPLPTAAATLIEAWRRARAPRETEAQEHERQAQEERARAWKAADDRQAWLSKLKPGSPFHRAEELAERGHSGRGQGKGPADTT